VKELDPHALTPEDQTAWSRFLARGSLITRAAIMYRSLLSDRRDAEMMRRLQISSTNFGPCAAFAALYIAEYQGRDLADAFNWNRSGLDPILVVYPLI
jgi:hypothetical protein